MKARKPNAPQDWLNKLPQMAKRLEDTLFKSAPDFESYNNPNTLKQRLQQLAMDMKGRSGNGGARRNVQSNQQGPNIIPQQPQQQQQQHHYQQPQLQQQQVQQQQKRNIVNVGDINPNMGRSQHPNQTNNVQASANSNLPQVAPGNYSSNSNFL